MTTFQDSAGAYLTQPEPLAILDIFSGQKTPQILELMQKLHVTPVYVPDGCTGYVQPMDTALNKLMNDKTCEILEELSKKSKLKV